jgi:hypothetical protein
MIVFKNPGLINVTALTTMGVNVKETENPIGIFGTGLKYAIAIILRAGGKIIVYRGLKRLEFGLRTKTVRGQEIKVVTMNGRELGFTDRMGLNWQMWMAYRELWSNTRDEKGHVWAIDDTTLSPFGSENSQPKRGTTTIIVECQEFERVHQTRHEIILQTSPEHSLKGVEVHPGESKYLYYRGIRVHELPKPSRYTYNLLGAQYLTEDRTILYPTLLAPQIMRAIVSCTWKPFLVDILDTGDRTTRETYEDSLSFASIKDEKPTVQFLEIAEQLKASKRLISGALSLFNHYQDTLPGYTSPFIVELTGAESVVVDEAITLVNNVVGSPGFAGIKIQFKSRIETGVRVTVGKSHMTLDHKIISHGRLYVARVLLEGLAMHKGGGVAEQLTNYMLTGKWVERELTEGYSKHSVDDDMPF